MNGSYYRDARLIEEKLEQAGSPYWAQQLDDVIEGGSSAASILLELRTTLIQIQDQHLDLPAQLNDDITQLTKALGRAPQ